MTLAKPVAKTLLPKIFPLAVIRPVVLRLPPTTLAVALSVVPEITLAPEILPPDPEVTILPPVILPVALTNPPVNRLPPMVFPVTVKLANVPTCVKLEYSTFELSVLPTKALAFTLAAATPVS